MPLHGNSFYLAIQISITKEKEDDKESCEFV